MKYKVNYDIEGVISNSKSGEKTPIYQIQALIDIPSLGVKAGDLGGFIEKEENLSQEGDCWVFKDSIVALGSLVAGNAVVRGGGRILQGSRLFDNAEVEGGEIFNSMLALDCTAIESTVVNCTFYKEGEILHSKVENITAWGAYINKSTVKAKVSKFWSIEGKMFIFKFSNFIYTGKKMLNLVHPLIVENSEMTNVKTLSLKSPLTIQNVSTIGISHLSTLGSEPDFVNLLCGNGKLHLLNKSRLYLKDSEVKLDGYISGRVHFDECAVDSMGSIQNLQGEPLILKKIKMNELSSVMKKYKLEVEIENIVLQGDDVLVC